MFVFAGLFTVIASAALMEWLGLSTALGAFIAGVMLADSPYRHELEADVEPFRSILLGLFFLSVGMMLNLHAIAERPLFVAGLALTLILVKTGIVFAIGVAFRMSWRSALALGVLLSQGGEFGFVLFAQARNAYLVAPDAASLFGAITTLSMATTPFLMAVTRPFREAPVERSEEREGPRAEGANAIVVGYGRFGQTVAQMLIASDIPVTLIDNDIEMIDVAGGFGAKVYFGDGTRLDLLRQAGAREAEIILFCTDGDQISAGMVEAVHEAFPNAAIYVRGYDRRASILLAGTPATVVREMIESAIKMARLALQGLDLSPEDIDRAEGMYRARDRERLTKQIETGDIRAARDRIITQTGLRQP
jgi:CPA2 family monovalent cation:H+ antiporter-2/glutathione-regulated potassium-efflux system protein KefB